MYISVQSRRVELPGGWISSEDIAKRVLSACAWPSFTPYLVWECGREPIRSPYELNLACRLVHAYHCIDMAADRDDLEETLEETAILEGRQVK